MNDDPNRRDAFIQWTARDVMTHPVHVVREHQLVSEVFDVMRDHNIRHVPIVDEDDVVVGLMTQRDLFRLQSPRFSDDGQWSYDAADLNAYILKAVMVRDPLCARLDMSFKEVLHRLVERHYGCLPVVDDHHRIKGIITRQDILRVVLNHILHGESGGSQTS